jgi:hypothetical protein
MRGHMYNFIINIKVPRSCVHDVGVSETENIKAIKFIPDLVSEEPYLATGVLELILELNLCDMLSALPLDRRRLFIIASSSISFEIAHQGNGGGAFLFTHGRRHLIYLDRSFLLHVMRGVPNLQDMCRDPCENGRLLNTCDMLRLNITLAEHPLPFVLVVLVRLEYSNSKVVLYEDIVGDLVNLLASQ